MMTTFWKDMLICMGIVLLLHYVSSQRYHEGQPVWGITNSTFQSDSRRVSERKCDEYYSQFVQSVNIPLIPNSESVIPPTCGEDAIELIAGGQSVVRPGEFPYMVLIGWPDPEGGYKCGGNLISHRFVLTLAHCAKDMHGTAPVIVKLGAKHLDDSIGTIEVAISKIHVYPNFTRLKRYDDIALLELATEVKFRANIRPTCLWTRPGFSEHTKALSAGWLLADRSADKSEQQLQKVSLSLLENDDCDRLLAEHKNRLWSGMSRSQVCASEMNEATKCRTHSGSPIQVVSKENKCIYYIMGVLSFGTRDCNTPAIYTRVYSYLDWIESIVWPDETAKYLNR